MRGLGLTQDGAVYCGLLARLSRGDVLPSGRMGYGAAFRVNGRPGSQGNLPDADRARAVLRRAVALGAALVDTADSYGPAWSEETVAGALHPYAPHVLVATKGGVTRLGPEATRLDARPSRLRAACEDSLRRLRVEAIGLYQLHWPDPAVPFADQVGALADLRAAGKVVEVGLCNVTAAEVQAATAIVPIAAVQGRFGLLDPAGAGLAGFCAASGIAFIAHGSLAVLRRPGFAGLAALSRRLGATPAQVALAWALQRLPNGILIPGTLRLDHLEENMAAGTVALSAEDGAALARGLA